LLGSASILAASPALQGKTYRAIVAELSPVSLFGRIAYVLAAHPSIPPRSVAELLKHASAQPGRLNYSSSGVGSASHLAMELFKSMARIDLTHVPFKGSAPAAIALIGGEVQVGFNNMVPALPHVKSGRLRALGVSGSTRWSGLPDVPTISASGVPGYEALQWYGVLLPAGTPGAIVHRLNEAIQTILQLPEVTEQLASEGGEVVGGTPKEFASYMEREIAKWTKVVKAAGIKAE
jgi:tripartite-type tricarboxylate transporter receptor subunit TctC